jgi:hypothetical protein
MHNIWILIFSYLLLVRADEGVARAVTPDGPTNVGYSEYLNGYVT